jgi:hypothetical protein
MPDEDVNNGEANGYDPVVSDASCLDLQHRSLGRCVPIEPNQTTPIPLYRITMTQGPDGDAGQRHLCTSSPATRYFAPHVFTSF